MGQIPVLSWAHRDRGWGARAEEDCALHWLVVVS